MENNISIGHDTPITEFMNHIVKSIVNQLELSIDVKRFVFDTAVNFTDEYDSKVCYNCDTLYVYLRPKYSNDLCPCCGEVMGTSTTVKTKVNFTNRDVDKE